jgi:hypothetical protein
MKTTITPGPGDGHAQDTAPLRDAGGIPAGIKEPGVVPPPSITYEAVLNSVPPTMST